VNRELGKVDVILACFTAVMLAVLAGCALSAFLMLALTRLFG
jgi:hypothetical protein